MGDVSPVVAAAGAVVTDLGNGTIQKDDGMTDTDERRHLSYSKIRTCLISMTYVNFLSRC